MAEPSARYQQLPNEEDPEENSHVAADAPPPYSSIAADNAAYFDYKEDGAFPKPPSYNVATTLPSYDEAERTKAETALPLVTGRVSVMFFSFNACGHIHYLHPHTNTHTVTSAQTLPVLSARQEVLSTLLPCFFFF